MAAASPSPFIPRGARRCALAGVLTALLVFALAARSAGAVMLTPLDSACSPALGCPNGAVVWASGSFARERMLTESVLRHNASQNASTGVMSALQAATASEGALWSIIPPPSPPPAAAAAAAAPSTFPLTLQLSLCCNYTFVERLAYDAGLFAHFVDELLFHTPIAARHRQALFQQHDMIISPSFDTLVLVASPLADAFAFRSQFDFVNPSTLYVSNRVLQCKCPTTMAVLPMLRFYRDELPEGLHLRGAGPRCLRDVEGASGNGGVAGDEEDLARPFVIEVSGAELPPLTMIEWRLAPASAVAGLRVQANGARLTLDPPKVNHRVAIHVRVGNNNWRVVTPSALRASIVVRRTFSLKRYLDATGEDLTKYREMKDVFVTVPNATFDFAVAAVASRSVTTASALPDPLQALGVTGFVVRAREAAHSGAADDSLQRTASDIMATLLIGRQRPVALTEGDAADRSYENAYMGHWTSQRSGHHGDVQELHPGRNDFVFDVSDIDDACPPAPIAFATVFSLRAVIDHPDAPTPHINLCTSLVELSAVPVAPTFAAFEAAAVVESHGWYRTGAFSAIGSWTCRELVTDTDESESVDGNPRSLGLLQLPELAEPSKLSFNISEVLGASSTGAKVPPTNGVDLDDEVAAIEMSNRRRAALSREGKQRGAGDVEFLVGCEWATVLRDVMGIERARARALAEAANHASQAHSPDGDENAGGGESGEGEAPRPLRMVDRDTAYLKLLVSAIPDEVTHQHPTSEEVVVLRAPTPTGVWRVNHTAVRLAFGHLLLLRIRGDATSPKGIFSPAPVVEGMLREAVAWYALLHPLCPEKLVRHHIRFLTVAPEPFVPRKVHLFGASSCISVAAPRPRRDEQGAWFFVVGADANGDVPQGSLASSTTDLWGDNLRGRPEAFSVAAVRRTDGEIEGSTDIHVCGVPELRPVTLLWNASNVKGIAFKYFVLHKCEVVPSFVTPLAAPREIRIPLSPPEHASPDQPPHDRIPNSTVRFKIETRKRHILIAGSSALIILAPRFNTTGGAAFVADPSSEMDPEESEAHARWLVLGGVDRIVSRAHVAHERSHVLGLRTPEDSAEPRATVETTIDLRLSVKVHHLRHGAVHRVGARFLSKSSPEVVPLEHVLGQGECPSTATSFTLVSAHAAPVLLPPNSIFDVRAGVFRADICQPFASAHLSHDLAMVMFAVDAECALLVGDANDDDGEKEEEGSGAIVRPLLNASRRDPQHIIGLQVPLPFVGARVICTLTLKHLVSDTADSLRVIYTRLAPQRDAEPFTMRLTGLRAAAGSYFVGSSPLIEVLRTSDTTHEAEASRRPAVGANGWRVMRSVPREYLADNYRGPEALLEDFHFSAVNRSNGAMGGSSDEDEQQALPRQCSADAHSCVELRSVAAGASVTVEYQTLDEMNPGVCPHVVVTEEFRSFRAELAHRDNQIIACAPHATIEAIALPLDMTDGTSIRGRWRIADGHVNNKSCERLVVENADAARTLVRGLSFGKCTLRWEVVREVFEDDGSDVRPVPATNSSDERRRKVRLHVLDSVELRIFVLTETLPFGSSLVTTQEALTIGITHSSIDWTVVRTPATMATEVTAYDEDPGWTLPWMAGGRRTAAAAQATTAWRWLDVESLPHGIAKLSYRLLPSPRLKHFPEMSMMVCPAAIVKFGSESTEKSTGPFTLEIHRIDVVVVASTNILTECDAYSGKGKISLELLPGRGGRSEAGNRAAQGQRFASRAPKVEFVRDTTLLQRRVRAFAKLMDAHLDAQRSPEPRSPWWITRGPGGARANWTAVALSPTVNFTAPTAISPPLQRATITVQTAFNDFFDTTKGFIATLDGIAIPEAVISGVYVSPRYERCLHRASPGAALGLGLDEHDALMATAAATERGASGSAAIAACVAAAPRLHVLLEDSTRTYRMRPLMVDSPLIDSGFVQYLNEEDLAAGRAVVQLNLLPLVSAPAARPFFPIDVPRCDIPARDLLAAWEIVPPAKAPNELVEAEEAALFGRFEREWERYVSEVRLDTACAIATPFVMDKATELQHGGGGAPSPRVSSDGDVPSRSRSEEYSPLLRKNLAFVLNFTLPAAPRFSISGTFRVAIKVPKPLVCGVTSASLHGQVAALLPEPDLAARLHYMSFAAASRFGLLRFGPAEVVNEPAHYSAGEDEIPQCSVESSMPVITVNVSGVTLRQNLTISDVELSVVSPAREQETEIERRSGLRTCISKFTASGAHIEVVTPRQLRVQFMPCSGLQINDNNDPYARVNPQVFSWRLRGAIISGLETTYDLYHDVSVKPTMVRLRVVSVTPAMVDAVGLAASQASAAGATGGSEDDFGEDFGFDYSSNAEGAQHTSTTPPPPSVWQERWPNMLCESAIKHGSGLAVSITLDGDKWSSMQLGNGEANVYNTAFLQAFSVWAPHSYQQKIAEIDATAAAIASSVLLDYISKFASARSILRINDTAATIFIPPVPKESRGPGGAQRLLSLGHKIEHLHFAVPGHVTVCEGCLLADEQLHIAGDTSGLVLSVREESNKIDVELDEDGIAVGHHTDGRIFDHAARPLHVTAMSGLPASVYYEPMCPATLQHAVLGASGYMTARYGASPVQVVAVVTLHFNQRGVQEEYVAPFSKMELAKLVHNAETVQGRVLVSIGRRRGERPSSELLKFLRADAQMPPHATRHNRIGQRHLQASPHANQPKRRAVPLAVLAARATIFVCPPFSSLSTNSTAAIRKTCVRSATRLIQLGGSRRPPDQGPSSLRAAVASSFDSVIAAGRWLGLLFPDGALSPVALPALLHHAGSGMLFDTVLLRGLQPLVMQVPAHRGSLLLRLMRVCLGGLLAVAAYNVSYTFWFAAWSLLWVAILMLGSSTVLHAPYFALHVALFLAALW